MIEVAIHDGDLELALGLAQCLWIFLPADRHLKEVLRQAARDAATSGKFSMQELRQFGEGLSEVRRLSWENPTRTKECLLAGSPA